MYASMFESWFYCMWTSADSQLWKLLNKESMKVHLNKLLRRCYDATT